MDKGKLNSEIYEMLRIFHGELKDFLLRPNKYEILNNKQKNALDAIHSVLYLAEGEFTDF